MDYLPLGNFLVACIGTIGYLLYECNIAGNSSRYGSLGGYLFFDDAWENIEDMHGNSIQRYT